MRSNNSKPTDEKVCRARVEWFLTLRSTQQQQPNFVLTMTSYVDVETSAEAIQEDEELIEAVEEIVQKSAEAIYADIKNEVSDIYMRIVVFIQLNFPFLIYWREDRSLFLSDMQKVSIFIALFTISFIILAPSNRWRRKLHHTHDKGRRRDETTTRSYFQSISPFSGKRKVPQARPGLPRSSSTSSIDYRMARPAGGMGDADYEAKEAESFARRWPAVLETPYRTLVLPPECKRVEKPKQRKQRKEDNKKEKPKKRRAKKDPHNDDNPAKRLVIYVRNILHLAFTFLRYDYVGAGWTLIRWVEACFQSRQKKDEPDNEEEDDDDVSEVGSLRGSSVTTQSTSVGIQQPDYRPKLRGKRDLVKADEAHDTGTSGERNDTVDDVLNVSLSIDPSLTDDNEEKKDTSTDRDEHSYQTPPASPLEPESDSSRMGPSHGQYATPSAEEERTEGLDPEDALAARIIMSGRPPPKMKDALQVSAMKRRDWQTHFILGT